MLLPGWFDLRGNVNLQKRGSDDGVLATSLMIKSAKGWKR